MVGWSSVELEIVRSALEKVWPALVLARIRMLLKAALNEAPYRFPKLSNEQVGSPPRAGQPSEPVNREIQDTPPLVVYAAELLVPRSLLQANMRLGLAGSMAIAVSA